MTTRTRSGFSRTLLAAASLAVAGAAVLTLAPTAAATDAPGIIDGDAVSVEQATSVVTPRAGTVAWLARPHNSLAARGVEHSRHPGHGARR